MQIKSPVTISSATGRSPRDATMSHSRMSRRHSLRRQASTKSSTAISCGADRRSTTTHASLEPDADRLRMMVDAPATILPRPASPLAQRRPEPPPMPLAVSRPVLPSAVGLVDRRTIDAGPGSAGALVMRVYIVDVHDQATAGGLL
jgi:hypothetical protein